MKMEEIQFWAAKRGCGEEANVMRRESKKQRDEEPKAEISSISGGIEAYRGGETEKGEMEETEEWKGGFM